MPEISVLIPIYNVESYLEECLDSLRAQTFRDFEAICINDGSTDGSRDIIQKYLDLDSRFKVIDKPNSGYGASMNLGLEQATGTYLAILESDDKFEPNALEFLYQTATQHEAEVVKADFWLYWSKPEEKQEVFGIVDGLPMNQLINPETEQEIFYRKPSIWSALYKRSFLEENEINFLETPGASYQDAGFNFKVWASASRVVLLKEPILYYRQDNEQSSVNSPSKVFCVCDEYAEMERYLKARPEKRKILESVKERMKFDSYLWNYDRLNDELKESFLKVAAEELKNDISSGDLDWSLFEPWSEADLRAMIESPEAFQESRGENLKPGKLNTFKRYYRLGGFPLIVKLLRYKQEHTQRHDEDHLGVEKKSPDQRRNTDSKDGRQIDNNSNIDSQAARTANKTGGE